MDRKWSPLLPKVGLWKMQMFFLVKCLLKTAFFSPALWSSNVGQSKQGAWGSVHHWTPSCPRIFYPHLVFIRDVRPHFGPKEFHKALDDRLLALLFLVNKMWLRRKIFCKWQKKNHFPLRHFCITAIQQIFKWKFILFKKRSHLNWKKNLAAI